MSSSSEDLIPQKSTPFKKPRREAKRMKPPKEYKVNRQALKDSGFYNVPVEYKNLPVWVQFVNYFEKSTKKDPSVYLNHLGKIRQVMYRLGGKKLSFDYKDFNKKGIREFKEFLESKDEGWVLSHSTILNYLKIVKQFNSFLLTHYVPYIQENDPTEHARLVNLKEWLNVEMRGPQNNCDKQNREKKVDAPPPTTH